MENETQSATEDKQQTQQKPTIQLPVLQTVQFIQDEATGMSWVGLPLSKMDLLEACIVLDQVKSHLAVWYKKVANRPHILKPNGLVNRALQQTKAFLNRRK